jgi:hypothetical protein
MHVEGIIDATTPACQGFDGPRRMDLVGAVRELARTGP